MSIQATLIKKSTGDILIRGALPVDPTNEVPGLDPDLEWLIDFQPFAAPLYDSRIFVLVTTQSVTAIPHPDYPLYNQYLIEYSTQRRNVGEIKTSIINKERTELTNHIDYMEKLAILGLAVLFRTTQGAVLNNKEQAIKKRVLDTAQKLWANHARREQLIAEIEQLESPDLDAEWATPDVNEPI